MCPSFDGSVLTDFEKYEKITWLPLIWTIFSFGCLSANCFALNYSTVECFDLCGMNNLIIITQVIVGAKKYESCWCALTTGSNWNVAKKSSSIVWTKAIAKDVSKVGGGCYWSAKTSSLGWHPWTILLYCSISISSSFSCSQGWPWTILLYCSIYWWRAGIRTASPFANDKVAFIIYFGSTPRLMTVIHSSACEKFFSLVNERKFATFMGVWTTYRLTSWFMLHFRSRSGQIYRRFQMPGLSYWT